MAYTLGRNNQILEFAPSMRSVVLAVFVGFSLIAGGSSQALTVMRADKYIKLTAFSQRILLIDIKEVKSRVIKTEGGLESREVTVVGTGVETIRGKSVGKEFVDKSEETRIVDREKADRTQPSDLIDILILNEKSPHRPASCKVGHRYLVIYLRDMTFFFEVSKDNENWRNQIQEFEEAM